MISGTTPPGKLATLVASTGDDLVGIGRAIREAQEQLSQLRLVRAVIVQAAVDEGMSQRQIAELLGITHTGVQKILQEREWFRATIDFLKTQGYTIDALGIRAPSAG